ncbi:phage baseplate assembly protein [Vibrio hepatarius]|uniref:phage baseplate assembly protein n=1 Tax=Vibrio hepatarius TaxID=171383 RepID=UPI00148C6DF1|nr:contractile injection system protein, VgrG/Pvc8 family [Vibrio hepatarius]NOI14842.1 phage tail protein [Vibrio hepatarius]
MDKVTLSAGGNIYSGWTKVSVTRSLQAMAGSFDLELTYKYQGDEDRYKAFVDPIKEGQPCVIKIGDDRVVTGYVDDWIPSYDANQVIIAVSGRDKTADLVDCAIEYPSGQFVNQTLTQIALTICKPFDINVVVQTSVGAPFERVQIEQGETPHELLTRLARQRGVLLTTDGHGNLVITRASKERAGFSLILGVNVLAARGRLSWRDRFSKFTVKASGAAFGSWDSNSASSVGGFKATITDDEITRYRPMIIVNDEITTAEGAARRGQWERQRSIGQSNTVEYTITGWRNPNTGKLLDTNKIVPVKDEIIGIDGDMLISGFMLDEGESGRVAVLSVVRPEALDIPPQAAKKTKIDGGKW